MAYRHLFLVFALLLFPAVAQAQPGIWLTLGDVEARIPPNPALNAGNNASDLGFVFRLRADSGPTMFSPGTALVYDIGEGAWGRGAGLADTTRLHVVEAGDGYRIYLAHFDHAGDGHYQGAIIFDEPIVAVIAGGYVHDQFERENSLPRDFVLPSDPVRGLELEEPAEDFIERTGDGFTVRFDLFTNPDFDPIDQFRVITLEPRVDAEVGMDCPDDVVAGEDGVAVISGRIQNSGSEVSPPVVLHILNDGAGLSDGEVRVEGRLLECEPFRGDTYCPVGRVPNGGPLEVVAEVTAPPGTVLNLTVQLLGSAADACEVRVTFPGDEPLPDAGSMSGTDGGVTPPPNPSTTPPGYGGAGVRCALTHGSEPPWAWFGGLLAGAITWRRRR